MSGSQRKKTSLCEQLKNLTIIAHKKQTLPMLAQEHRVRSIFRFFKTKMIRSPKKASLISFLASMEGRNNSPSSLVLLMRHLTFSKILMQDYLVRHPIHRMLSNLQRGARRVVALINPVAETVKPPAKILSSLK